MTYELASNLETFLEATRQRIWDASDKEKLDEYRDKSLSEALNFIEIVKAEIERSQQAFR